MLEVCHLKCASMSGKQNRPFAFSTWIPKELTRASTTSGLCPGREARVAAEVRSHPLHTLP
eukprot:2537984-Pyramimonas_sp.AAC.1